MRCDMMGQGGGHVGGVAEVREYFLRQRWRMFGHGGGRELPIVKVGVGVGKIGKGGGRRFVVVPVGVCVPWGCLLRLLFGQGWGRHLVVVPAGVCAPRWCLLRFLFGHGCGRNREVK